jgi:hypothetical protein
VKAAAVLNLGRFIERLMGRDIAGVGQFRQWVLSG